MGTEQNDAAIAYARAGWRIFPLHTPQAQGCSCGTPDCSKIGKHPRIANWQNDASDDPAKVAEWWAQWPDANIGMGLEGLVVLDVDPRHGGFDSLKALETEHGPLDLRARQQSGSGGWHYLFERTEVVKIHRGFKLGLDLLTGAGCYIVVAPSLHASGGRYQWTDEPHPLLSSRDSITLATPPQWLLDVSQGKQPNRRSTEPRPARERVRMARIFGMATERVHGGEGRNDAGLWLFAQLRDNGYSRDEVSVTLPDWVSQANEAKPNEDPYTLGEAEASLRSAYIREAREAWKQGDSGLTQELAGAIKGAASFARDAGGRLYVFENGVYKATGTRFVERRVKELCEGWKKTKGWSPELATRVTQWIVVDAPELWEHPPLDVLNCKNGLLDIRTRTLHPHSPEHLSPVQIAAAFAPAATCPHIETFVRDVFPMDTQKLPFEIAAWLMLPDASIQKAVLLLGEGANGKSAWLNLLRTFLGSENVSSLSLHRIEADKFSAARLVGKLCNIGTDLPTAELAGTSLFKALTGGDAITAERKFEASFEFRPFVRLLFSANSAPRSDDATHGFFRRWLVIPFNRTFDASDPDTVPRAVLDARLSEPAELSGMLNRALNELVTIQRGSFTESPTTREALNEFRMTTDPLAVWLEENTVEAPESWLPKDQLRRAYGQACRDNGRPFMGDVQFTGALKRIRPKVQPGKRRKGGCLVPVYVGLEFVTHDPVPGAERF